MKTVSDIAEMIKEVGVKKALEGFVLFLDTVENPEDYSRKLKEELPKLLAEYEYRYSWDEEGQDERP